MGRVTNSIVQHFHDAQLLLFMARSCRPCVYVGKFCDNARFVASTADS